MGLSYAAVSSYRTAALSTLSHCESIACSNASWHAFSPHRSVKVGHPSGTESDELRICVRRQVFQGPRLAPPLAVLQRLPSTVGMRSLRLLRHEWQPNSEVAQDIEAAVAKLLSDPAQARLAEKQMQTA